MENRKINLDEAREFFRRIRERVKPGEYDAFVISVYVRRKCAPEPIRSFIPLHKNLVYGEAVYPTSEGAFLSSLLRSVGVAENTLVVSGERVLDASGFTAVYLDFSPKSIFGLSSRVAGRAVEVALGEAGRGVVQLSRASRGGRIRVERVLSESSVALLTLLHPYKLLLKASDSYRERGDLFLIDIDTKDRGTLRETLEAVIVGGEAIVVVETRNGYHIGARITDGEALREIKKSLGRVGEIKKQTKIAVAGARICGFPVRLVDPP